jgi:hypothetical protein
MERIPTGSIGFRLAHELEGLLDGIRADGIINDLERGRLERWLQANQPYVHMAPFSELARHVERALQDGQLTLDECEDLLFVLSKLTTVNPYFDALRAGLQVLMGLLAGVMADHTLHEREAMAMGGWLQQWSHLKGLWPYDECEAIVQTMLSCNCVTADTAKLAALAEQFPVAGDVPYETAPPLISGICAVNPNLAFERRTFTFTGESSRAIRQTLSSYVAALGGTTADAVTKGTHYLIVCDSGNPHWAFACYGRKVEKAYHMRRHGHPITIAHEHDFWNALVAHGITV